MKRIKLQLTALLLTVLCLSTSAQDIHFSQFYAAPMNMNPALTGLFDGSYRFIANYKSQWGSVSVDAPYSTFAGSFDFRVPKGFAPYDNVAFGVSMFNDKAGDSEFRDFSMTFAASYIKVLNSYRNMYASIGIHGGFNNRSINYLNLRFGSQYNGEAYDPNLPGEDLNFLYDNFTVGEVGAGLAWWYIPKDRFYVYVSGSAFHLNQPNVTFFDGSEKISLDPRWTVTLGSQIPLGSSPFDVLPSILFLKQGPNTEGNVGTMIKYNIDKKTGVGIGAWTRIGSKLAENPWADAVIVATRVDFSNLTLGVSYDVNVSDLRRGSNTRGSIELSMIYINPSKKRAQTLNCPRF